MNESPKVTQQPKFNIRITLNPNPKRLSLSQKPKRKSPTKKFTTLALPGIGQMFVNNLINSDSQCRQTEEKTSQLTEFQLSQLKRRTSSVNQKILTNKENLVSRKNVRLSLGPINDLNKKTVEFCMKLQQDKQNINSEQTVEGTQIDYKILRKRSAKRISFFREQQEKRPQMCDATVQTNAFEKNSLSYDEFVKFQVTQKQAYEKMKNLFGYIQKLSDLESQNRNCNQKQFEGIFGHKFDDKREKRVQELVKDVFESSESFTSLFKQIFIKQSKMCRYFIKSQQHMNESMKTTLKQVQQRIIQIMVEKDLFKNAITPKEIKEAFDETLDKLDAIVESNKQVLNIKMSQCYKYEREIEERYAEWERNVSEQSRLIKNCVMSILELPQLSMGLFGFQQLSNHQQTVENIKKYCLNSRQVPNLTDFFMRNDHPDEKEINEAFRKCCEVKCMNCIYIRGKIRMFYNKNNQLKPVIKALMQLVKTDHKQVELHRRLSRSGPSTNPPPY